MVAFLCQHSPLGTNSVLEPIGTFGLGLRGFETKGVGPELDNILSIDSIMISSLNF